MRLDLGGTIVEMTSATNDRATYTATVDGRPMPIRRRFRSRRARTYDPHDFLNDWQEAERFYLPQLYHAQHATPERIGDVWVFHFAETSGPRTLYLGTIEIAVRDGAVVIDMLLERQLLRLDLGGPVLEFVQVENDLGERYAAEIDGVRVPIRLHRSETSPSGTEVTDEEGITLVLWDLADLSDKPDRDGPAFVFRIERTFHEYIRKTGRVAIVYDGTIVHWSAEVTMEGEY